ncbi:hypothetical protein [Haloterrigena alkaliphila]|uniref:Uncharacterized protein n=1 Tax=Haloterrigena alkaliphila TaxID=2816475 RepID=A0A8A2V905_9EURY|nr:hypothetical protein [Haloterrigena alkaliphila]QSW98403.1 DUF4198 domain-containing protein [Haloterrigena alkaliphila]
MNRRLLTVSMVVVLCTALFGPAAAAGAANQPETAIQDESTENDVTVTTGAQLSTIVTATSDEVRTEFENTAFDERMADNASDRAAAIAERAAALENRSTTLRAEYENATAAYEVGDLEKSAYAQRLASLSARAENVVSSYERLEERVESVDEIDRRAAGVTPSELADQRAAVADLTSSGADALFQQFTGETNGNAEIEVDGGVSIEVETDDGERTREYERPRDGDGSLAISQTDALDAATDVLSPVEDGNWTVTEAETDDGVYEFEFVLAGAETGETGEAEVSVDGETGTVFELEEEIERRDAADDEDEADEKEDEDERLVVLVASGSPDPGEQVTLKLLANGQPAADAAVTVNDRAVGTTNDDGELTVTLPVEEAEIEAEHGDAEGELEFEFDDGSGDEDAESQFNADATIDNGTVTVSATFDESPVAGATVVANDETVGTTGEDGTVSFALDDDTDELEIEVLRGELESELEFELESDEEDEDEEEDEEDEEDEDEEDDETDQ